jgi:hypothetical protein
MVAETVAELEKALREQKRMEELNLMFDIAVELNMYPSRYIFYMAYYAPSETTRGLILYGTDRVTESMAPPLFLQVLGPPPGVAGGRVGKGPSPIASFLLQCSPSNMDSASFRTWAVAVN